MSKHTRHDRFFRQMLRFPSFQQGFIRFRVPSKITAPVNLKKLELAPEAFVRANKTIVPDCVLRAPFKEGSGWAYFPIEQQTNPNDDMAARAMITKGRILEFEMNIQKNKVPPLIWHIVFSSGRRRWRKSLDLFDRLPSSTKELARWALTAPPQLIQLLELPDERTSGCPELDAAELMMKKAYDDPVRVLADLEPLLARVLRCKGGTAMLQAMVDYVFPGDGHEQADAFILGVERVLTREDVRRVVMSFSEIFRHEGKQLGLQEGKQLGLHEGKQLGLHEGKQLGLQEGLEKGKLAGKLEGKLETARSLLVAGIDPKVIAKATGLPRQKLAALRKQ